MQAGRDLPVGGQAVLEGVMMRGVDLGGGGAQAYARVGPARRVDSKDAAEGQIEVVTSR